ncbi:unnamed protein product [Notodromas monacha]|uniref:Uncharacterized protein n=1 Tax=Notodromas monacha TaxID=399045 RepID=A0A7R9BET2_9CRUS|nr:unnamed protein product [Notodromas monacha]CAG0912490.1 unnamed protein product [Notodromas monacha]
MREDFILTIVLIAFAMLAIDALPQVTFGSGTKIARVSRLRAHGVFASRRRKGEHAHCRHLSDLRCRQRLYLYYSDTTDTPTRETTTTTEVEMDSTDATTSTADVESSARNDVHVDAKDSVVILISKTTEKPEQSSGEQLAENETKQSSKSTRPTVLYLKTRSSIKYRYAVTETVSKVLNPDSKSNEIVFSLTLPESAFISKFSISNARVPQKRSASAFPLVRVTAVESLEATSVAEMESYSDTTDTPTRTEVEMDSTDATTSTADAESSARNDVHVDAKDSVVILISKTTEKPEQSSGEQLAENETKQSSKSTRPTVLYLKTRSSIKYRYAVTETVSKVLNPLSFREIDHVVYEASVEKKEKAKEVYDAAVQAGQSAALVAVNPRDSTRFSVSVNVGAKEKVTFTLIYEELLLRRNGFYEQRINLNPGQTEKPEQSSGEQLAENETKQSSKSTRPTVLYLKTRSSIKYRYAVTETVSKVLNPDSKSNEIVFSLTLPESAFISKFSMEIDHVVYEASVEKKEKAKEVYDAAVQAGQSAALVAVNPRDSTRFSVSVNVGAKEKVTFTLIYEELLLRRNGFYEQRINLNPGQLVPTLEVHVDIQEAKNFTKLIVPELRKELLVENEKVSSESRDHAPIVWEPEIQEKNITADTDPLAPRKVTPDLIKRANAHIDSWTADGQTDIDSALKLAFKQAQKSVKGQENEVAPESLAQMIILERPSVTDTRFIVSSGETDTERIVKNMLKRNEEASNKVLLFTIAFGDDTNFKFLKKLGLRNNGFARKIYADSDSSLQLTGFFEEISSPILTNVNITYLGGKVDEDSTPTAQPSQNVTAFRGTEIVMTGKLESASDRLTAYTVSALAQQGSVTFNGTASDVVEMDLNDKSSFRPYSNFLERLWAYQTVRLTLDRMETVDEEEKLSALKEKALNISLKACVFDSTLTPRDQLIEDTPEPKKKSSHRKVYLRYKICKPAAKEESIHRLNDRNASTPLMGENIKFSFVTPLTSLVVNKPDQNETGSQVQAKLSAEDLDADAGNPAFAVASNYQQQSASGYFKIPRLSYPCVARGCMMTLVCALDKKVKQCKFFV